MIQLDFIEDGYDAYYTVDESQPIRVRALHGCDSSSLNLIVVLFDEKGKRVDLLTESKTSAQGIYYSKSDSELDEKVIDLTFNKLPKQVNSIRVYLVEPNMNPVKQEFISYFISQNLLEYSSKVFKNDKVSRSILVCEFKKKSSWELKKTSCYSKFSKRDLLDPKFSLSYKSKTQNINGKQKEGFLARACKFKSKFTHYAKNLYSKVYIWN